MLPMYPCCLMADVDTHILLPTTEWDVLEVGVLLVGDRPVQGAKPASTET
jgi:hypothetical protein